MVRILNIKRLKTRFLVFATIASIIVGILLPLMRPPRATAAPNVTIVGSQVGDSAYYLSIPSYKAIRSSVDWPLRSENGCPPGGNNGSYKAMPWLAKSPTGITPVFEGNDMNAGGDCTDRFRDGGHNSGAWLSPFYMNWATDGNQMLSGSATSGSSEKVSYCYAGAQLIWGAGISQTDYFSTLYPGANKTASDGKSYSIYSQGSTLFRKHFNVTQAHLDTANLSGNGIYLRTVTDDWSQVYVNGNLVIRDSYTISYNAVNIASYLRVGSNNIAIQSVDKLGWSVDPNVPVAGAGLCYAIYLVENTPPPPPPPAPTATCVVAPQSAAVGSTIIPQVTITHGGPFGSPNISVTGTITIQSQSKNITPLTLAYPNSATTTTGSGYLMNTPGTYTFTGNLWATYATGSFNFGCTGGSVSITNPSEPYLHTYGNDVQAGGGFADTDGKCTQQGVGDVKAYNKESTGNYAGSGSQLGVFATGNISGFRSASTLAGSLFKLLSFANTSDPPGKYGAVQCINNYWTAAAGNKTVTTQAIDISTFGATDPATTRYLITPTNPALPIVLSGELPNGRKLALYIEGNVLVRANAAGHFGYASKTWPTLGSIPSLYIIAHGNIAIASNVRAMDGQYVAQPTNVPLPPALPSDGRITTCVDPTTGATLAGAAYITNCDYQLVITGSFSATHVNFLRLASQSPVAGESAATSKAAEIFVYGVESFISNSPLLLKDTQDYDSIISMPPSL